MIKYIFFKLNIILFIIIEDYNKCFKNRKIIFIFYNDIVYNFIFKEVEGLGYKMLCFFLLIRVYFCEMN